MKEQLQDIQLESKDILIDVLKDTIDDKNKVVRRLQILLSVISVLSLLLLFGLHLYNDWSFKEFISQYDIENTATITTTTDNNSKISNSGNTNAQNNININMPKVGKER